MWMHFKVRRCEVSINLTATVIILLIVKLL